jgi:transcriptional adapter 2-alpha
MLAEMEFSLDEHPSERELKLQVVRIYNHKLAERNRRKQFAIERGLVDFKHQQQVSLSVLLIGRLPGH